MGKIADWFKKQGATLKKYKFSLYLFLSMLAMVFIVNVFNIAPLSAVVIIMGLGVFKQLIWGVIIHKQKFDWVDLVFMLIGCGFGFLFTMGWYKSRGIW